MFKVSNTSSESGILIKQKKCYFIKYPPGRFSTDHVELFFLGRAPASRHKKTSLMGEEESSF